MIGVIERHKEIHVVEMWIVPEEEVEQDAPEVAVELQEFQELFNDDCNEMLTQIYSGQETQRNTTLLRSLLNKTRDPRGDLAMLRIQLSFILICCLQTILGTWLLEKLTNTRIFGEKWT